MASTSPYGNKPCKNRIRSLQSLQLTKYHLIERLKEISLALKPAKDGKAFPAAYGKFLERKLPEEASRENFVRKLATAVERSVCACASVSLGNETCVCKYYRYIPS